MNGRLIAGLAANVLFFAVPLFLPAGTLDWWRAWVIVGLSFAGSLGAVVSLSRSHPALIEERLRPPIQRGQPLADKLLLPALLLASLCLPAFASFDVFHLRLLAKPPAAVSSLGLALFVAGWTLAYLGLRENAFAAAVVRHQEERGQAVIDTGVYGIVRHPMYAGGVLLMAGMPLWLESYAGALASSVPIALLVARTVLEERFLRRELTGYEAYTRRVRFRIAPFLW